jgi:hypothetical protein
VADLFTAPEIRALAETYCTPLSAVQLLERAGLRRGAQPGFTGLTTPLQFWREVNAALGSGVLADGRTRILAAAREDYPANPTFRPAGGSWPGGTGGGGSEVGGTGSGGTGSGGTGGGGSGLGGGPAGPSGGGLGSEPVAVTVVALDAVGFSKRGALVQLAWRDGIRQVVGDALAAAGVPGGAAVAQDRGDGFLMAVRATVPRPRLVADFVRELRIALGAYNRTRNADGRVRLRVAMHLGDVVIDGTGFAGDATVVASRLVDADPVREAFETDPAEDVALIISPELYETTVAGRFRGLDPGSFRRVDVHMRKFAGSAWVELPRRAPTTPGPPPGAAGSRGGGATRPGTADSPGGAASAAPPDHSNWDFLISCAGQDQTWGEWVAWHLTAQGHRVHLEAWEEVAGNFHPYRLHDAILQSRRTLVILTKRYLDSQAVRTEWQAAWHSDPNGVSRLLVPVRVEPCEPGGLLRGIRYIDLVGMQDEEKAAEFLVKEVEAALRGRREPPAGPPPFPGRPR